MHSTMPCRYSVDNYEEESVIVHDTKVKRVNYLLQLGDRVQRKIADPEKQLEAPVGFVREVRSSSEDSPVTVLYDDGYEASYEHGELVLVFSRHDGMLPPPMPEETPAELGGDHNQIAKCMTFLGEVSRVMPGWTFALERLSNGNWALRSHDTNPFLATSLFVNADLEALLVEASDAYRKALSDLRLMARARLASAELDIRRVGSLLDVVDDEDTVETHPERRSGTALRFDWASREVDEDEDELPIRYMPKEFWERVSGKK